VVIVDLFNIFPTVRVPGHLDAVRLQRVNASQARAQNSNSKPVQESGQPSIDFFLRNREKRCGLLQRVSLELPHPRRRSLHPQREGQDDVGRQKPDRKPSTYLVRNSHPELGPRTLVSLRLPDAR